MVEGKSYGAVDLPKGNEDFDVKNTYYLNESGFQWKRFCRGALPVVIALLIMGGFAYGMSHGFNHLYGPPKSVDENNSIKEENWVIDTPAIAHETDETTEEISTNENNRECSKNHKCAKLGLEGFCCPTNEGSMLECCGS